MAAITVNNVDKEHQESVPSTARREFSIRISDAQADLGGKRTQQDFGFTFQGENWAVVAIFDGHGNDGHSNVAGAAALSIIEQDGFYEMLVSDPETTSQTIFDRMQQSNFDLILERLHNKGVEYEIRDGYIFCTRNGILRGGTTATLVFADTSGLVTTMNVGDSDAWLFDSQKGTKLTAEHFPETPGEFDRIVASKYPRGYGSSSTDPAGCPSKCVYDLAHFMKDSRGIELDANAIHGETPLNPYFVCNMDKKPATLIQVTDEKGTKHKLAMTRSIGDENLRKGGVISKPDVSQCRIYSPSVIKIASDGLWDAIDTSKEHFNTTEAIDALGMDPNSLCVNWFRKTKRLSEGLFGSNGDNMWAYVMTMD